jgi:predicted dehydrogenase
MSNKRPVSFAVIGYGHIGRRHVSIIQQHEQCKLVAVADTVAPSATELKNLRVPFLRSIGELVKEEFDVLCVATPNGLHEFHAVQALQAGHHAVIEKPMSLTGAACQNIIDTAAANGRQVFCVLQNRYSAIAQWLKNLVEGNVLGKIYMVQVNCFWNRNEQYYDEKPWRGSLELDGGTLFTQFSHYIDTLYWLFGEMRNMRTELRNFNHPATQFEDSGIVSFSLEDGALGSFVFTTAVWDSTYESTLTIIAQNGYVKVGGQYMDRVIDCVLKDNVQPPNAVNSADKLHNHRLFLDDVIAHVRNGLGMGSNAGDGMKLVEMIEQMYSVAKTNSQVISK